ncbi:MAG: Tfp pilus assembly protein PilB [Parcubacteria group bacterium GW2011_GWB1_43_8]|nr:MAG: Tfp pilus assembly protein PilB [Parcubacteria group bacterium GW2011_GWB1_43_8]
MKVETKKLKLFLLDSGLITSKDITEAERNVKKTGEDLGDALVSGGKISEDDLRRLEAYILGIPFVGLEKEKIDFAVLSLIPEPIARNHNIVAYRKNKDELEVAMLDPEDLGTIDFIKKKASLKILPRLTNSKSIKSALSQYQESLQAEFSDIVKKEAESLKVVISGEGESGSESDLKKLAEDIPIVRIVETLLKHAILQRASDIHIEPMEREVLIRYRIDGILRDTMVLPKNTAPGITARIKILANLKIDEKRLPQDGRFKIETAEDKVSFRVSVLPVYNGEKIVMRILLENSKGFSFETLGFLASQIEDVHWAINRPTGMILVTGPTGSGKTTTLYTALDILNTPDVNISTIEDPIEYQIPRINQTQVKPDIGFTFANGLRSLVRQDPDIIMVGEIRDNETASLAVNAALTGHLVLSTLHTNSAAGAVPRLLDMEVEPFLMASTVNVIIAQRLVRTLCSGKEKYFLNSQQLEMLSKEVDLDRVAGFLAKEKITGKISDWSKVPFYKPSLDKDCPEGYKGRVGVHEILRVSEGIRNLIMGNATSDDIEKQAKKEGMMTMLEDGVVKCVQGVTTIEEILRVTSE